MTIPIFILFCITFFFNIEQSFDNQGMPIDLYKNYESLIPTIKETLSKKDISSLKHLITAFVQIKGKNNFFV
jgi:P2-related tail formation protein